MTPPKGSEPPDESDLAYTNSAADNARTGATGGIIISGFDTYFGIDDTVLGRYRSAVRYLYSGAASTAARVITQAVEDGLLDFDLGRRNEVAYYWLLAILSGRSFEQLGQGDFAACSRARRAAARSQPDQWLSASDVIGKVLDGLGRQAQSGDPDPALGTLADDYASLLPIFQEDFERHLSPLLAGCRNVDLDTLVASRAADERWSGDRAGRAWKYFEQKPEPPREREIRDPALSPGQVALALVGAVLVMGAVCVLAFELQRRGVLRAAGLTALILLGIPGGAYWGISFLADVERLADRERAFGGYRQTRYSSPVPSVPEVALADDSDDLAEAMKARLDRTTRTRFVRMATRHLNDQISALAPEAPGPASRWRALMTRMREPLRNEILSQYTELSLAMASLNWLITWRVSEVLRAFTDGSLYAYQKEMRPRLRELLAFVADIGVSAAALIFALTLILLKHPAASVIVVFVLAASWLAVVASTLDVYLVNRRRLAPDRKDARAQYEADLAEYERWLDVLEDRPADAEMAHWLDYDKLVLKNLSMAQLGLVAQDVLSYATMTEPAKDSTLARYALGPPRATEYQVTVFLFTRSGVRQVGIILDFRTGKASDQVRRSFRYEVIKLARVREKGVRYDTGIRQTMAEQSADVRRSVNGAAMLRRDFRLTLENLEHVVFLVESPDKAIASISDEDPVSVLDLALDTSGVAVALEILEAISTLDRLRSA